MHYPHAFAPTPIAGAAYAVETHAEEVVFFSRDHEPVGRLRARGAWTVEVRDGRTWVPIATDVAALPSAVHVLREHFAAGGTVRVPAVRF